MTYQSDVGGVRGRTAIGYKKDGTLVVYCWKDGSSGACTPESLATKMLSYGCIDALCLDGGKSVQIDCDSGKITSSRKTANYICIWVDDDSKPTVAPICPYREPTINIKNGSTGEGAKWLQWYLNVVANAGLVVDGIIGTKSVKAIKTFQSNSNLTVDGICGKNTRKALKDRYDNN